jgi:Tfp pilus assembly protein PilF
MKSKLQILILALLVAACIPAAHAQQGKVAGTCIGMDGKPLVDATVLFQNQDTGQKYTMKTDKDGKYSSIGIALGKYKATLSQDGKQLFYFSGVPVTLTEDGSPTQVDFNLPKEAASQAGSNPQAQQQATEQQKKIAAENAQISKLNGMLNQATQLEQAGNYDQAIALLKQASVEGGTHDLIWARLGDAQLMAAAKAPDKAAATTLYQGAADAYKKAVELKPNDGPYHNNLGQAYAKSGHPQEALAEYTAAAQDDPTHAATYYFNLGAILTNQGTYETNPDTKKKDLEEANASFDKAIAAKPDYAEAWYQKATNLLASATTDPKTGKMIVPPGTADAYNKYLELDPQGPHAADAKSILAALGEQVKTSYKKGGKSQ